VRYLEKYRDNFTLYVFDTAVIILKKVLCTAIDSQVGRYMTLPIKYPVAVNKIHRIKKKY